MTRHPTTFRLFTLLATATLAGACGGDDPTAPTDPIAPPEPPRAATLAIDPGTVRFSAFDETAQLRAIVHDQYGDVIAGASVAWRTDAPAVAAVDASGMVRATGNGTATITASVGAVSGTMEATVAQAVDGLEVTQGRDVTLVGATVQFGAAALDANGHPVGDAEFSWTSTDETVATVDADGLVTATGGGIVTITARTMDLQAQATLEVLVLDVHAYLESNGRVAQALVWAGTDNQPRPYGEWPQALKDKLTTAAARLYGEGTGLPPVLENLAADAVDGHYGITLHSAGAAEDIYAATVAHSLLLELAGTVPWSLDDLSDHELALLFDGRHLYTDYRTAYGVTGYYVGSWSPPAPPDFIWAFMTEEGLIGATRYETIVNTLHWARYHLYHYGWPSDRTGYEIDVDHWDYRGGPPVARVLTQSTRKRDGKRGHPTAGCHGTNRLLVHVLRAANIPAEYIKWAGHATPSFPSEGLYLSHGDDLYSTTTRYSDPFPEPFPTADLLIDHETYSEWFNTSNSHEENLNNIGRRGTELLVEHLPQSILGARCWDIDNGLSKEESLVYRRGIGRYWTVAELEAMQFWQRMDGKIARYSGCPIPPTRYRGGDP